MSMLNKRIIFNSSMPRAGSTLLQNILAQNPRFYASPTSAVINMLIGARVSYTESPIVKAQDRKLMRPAFLNLCRRGLEGYYECITDKPVCFDKSRDWIHFFEWVNAFYPEQKVIVCVRDLRAIISSMEKQFRKNRDLMDRSDLVDSPNMVTMTNRIRFYLNGYPLGVHLLRLMEAIETRRINTFHVIRFEELTSNPQSTMRKVYEFLSESWFEHDFNHITQVTQENDAYSAPYGDHTIRETVEAVRPDYNEVLTRDLANMIKSSNPKYYEAFYPKTV